MAYKTGDRYQINMLPTSIEEYISEGDPVRAYDAFVEALDIETLGLTINTNKVGPSAYEPKSMIKLLVYGYSYGWRSSRKLERATHHNLSFIWLLGGLKPDHKTIARFRSENKEVIRNILKQCAQICLKLNLIEGNTLFVDGSKFRANAGIKNTKTKASWEQGLKEIDLQIDKILDECTNIDQDENGSFVTMNEELKDKKILKAKIESMLKQMDIQSKERINSTDKDCVRIRGRQGSHVGYNSQVVVDEKNGLIVSTDVVDENNDLHQFSSQIMQANEVLGKQCKTACADAGYSNTSNLKECLEAGINVVVPSQKQIELSRKIDKEIYQFIYDAEMNRYICPEGTYLEYSYFHKKKQTDRYKIRPKTACKKCHNFGKCTSSKDGKVISRLADEKTKDKLNQIYASPDGQAIYSKRKQKIELVFGHIKRNLNAGSFLLRGLKGVNTEMAINSTCFNIARMITVFGGVREFVEKLA